MATFRDQRLRSRPFVRNGITRPAGPIDPVRPEARAILVPAIAVMIADRVVDEAELGEIDRIAGRHPFLRTLAGGDLRWIVDEVQAEILADGETAVFVVAAANLDPTNREMAILFAFAMAGADGNTEDVELKSIVKAAQTFGISSERLEDLARTARDEMGG